jgi:uncharacterized protein
VTPDPDPPSSPGPGEPTRENRLARESSPYLRQHAHNPVEWHPWGPETLERARAEDRPILLSIGYSACHWCHVMERESFDDPETARIMNEGFVNVKVDREERPDVDAIYMRAVQAMTGHGGWPLTVFLTPRGLPFFGGTYFPPEPRHGMPSFRQVLDAGLRAWTERRDDVEGAAERLLEILEKANLGEGDADPSGEAILDETLPVRGARTLLHRFDPAHGGFGGAPKFPQPVVLEFLLEHHAANGDAPSLEASLHTLRQMARGGIRDHLGGGFHRYSVDARWLVPHFEKMLYDNALLASAYLKGFQLSGDEELEAVCREILEYLLVDLRSPEGGFYSARDADSEGEEGTFYLWNRSEVDQLLGPETAELFRHCYDVSGGGNFEGRNILHLPHDLDAVARGRDLSRETLDRVLADARSALEERRRDREHPFRDEKILAGWNGLALRALAEAGAALGEMRYVEAAREGAAWLLEVLRPGGPGTAFLHQITDGKAAIPAFLEDVASMGNALVSLHEATLDPMWLREALALADEAEARFRDPETGLLHDSPSDGEELVIRPREVMDNPLPSGTSQAAALFLRLGRILGRDELVERSRALVAREIPGMIRMPAGFGRLLAVAARLVQPGVEVAILGDPDREEGARALLREAHRDCVPGRVVAGWDGKGEPPWPESPLFRGRTRTDARPTAYVCRNYACRAPVTGAGDLREQLREA